MNWKSILVSFGISCGMVRLGWADMDPALQTSSAAVVSPTAKHAKKHHKIAKKTSDTPKVMVLSNDDLPKRHRYYATDTPDAQATAVPVTTPSEGTRAATPAAAASAVPVTPNPINAVDAVAPRIAPDSSASDVPVPDASAVHSANDLAKQPPVTDRP